MGNAPCCSDDTRLKQMNNDRQQEKKAQEVVPQQKKQEVEPVQNKPKQQSYIIPVPQQREIQREPSPRIPQIPPKIVETLEKHNFFDKYLAKDNEESTINYAEHIYHGQINKDQLRPQGLGTLYKKDGALVIGNFKLGKLNGRGVYIFINGSYFEGTFINNLANCQNGYYQSEYLKYKGGFKDNNFHGYGIQENVNYSFQGDYVNGLKQNGMFKWKDQNGHAYEYNGTFNEKQEFHGHGTLKQKRGVYKGNFVNGHKQGKGFYTGKNGIKYQGDYRNGKKQGYGMLYNKEDVVTYKGEFKNGVPHGKGAAYVKGKEDSKFIQAEFIQGVDKSILQRAENSLQVPLEATFHKK